MNRRAHARLATAALGLSLALGLQGAALAQAKKNSGAIPGFGTNSKEPIKIDADKLEVFNKEQRAVYTGNVIAIQGETTIKCPTMIVYFERQNKEGAAASGSAAATPAAATEGGQESGGTQLKRVEAKGGVTVISKDQIATGNEGVFDRLANRIILTGNVALSQGENVTKGDKLVYNTETGVATVEGGRVKGFFVPGNDEADGAGKKKPAKPKS
ncbi:organic solvent tolerance protein OstA [Alsobacter soli]|uniref:Organic solvent tolerance protein OstA n=1 Tax=Alsobacter soli TaxID=2109933 RepID=A0A2T1HQX9_9HYPH|nr:LptA/OstA family protein [Alsobacter soli]PSC04061.1 organic solvent tolerance protein OstA [Alsobacter soli]